MSEEKHLQDLTEKEWKEATDEQLIQALFTIPNFVDPFFINYVKRDRPAAMRQYLVMHSANGGHMGKYANDFLYGNKKKRR